MSDLRENITTVKALLKRNEAKIAAVLPEHLDPDKLMQIATTVVQRTPKIAECTPRSLLGACIQSAQVGLSLDPILGESYIVPYNAKVDGQWIKQAQFQLGYRGLIKLARNSGEISTIMAMPVYADDEYNEVISEKGVEFEHVPSRNPANNDDLVCVYVVFNFRSGGIHWGRMWKWEIDLVRETSAGYQSSLKYNSDSPWTTSYIEMAKKTVVRRESKYLPLSTEAMSAISSEDSQGEVVPVELEADEPAQTATVVDESAKDTNGAAQDALDQITQRLEGGEEE
jgi:recombination protein RecT